MNWNQLQDRKGFPRTDWYMSPTKKDVTASGLPPNYWHSCAIIHRSLNLLQGLAFCLRHDLRDKQNGHGTDEGEKEECTCMIHKYDRHISEIVLLQFWCDSNLTANYQTVCAFELWCSNCGAIPYASAAENIVCKVVTNKVLLLEDFKSLGHLKSSSSWGSWRQKKLPMNRTSSPESPSFHRFLLYLWEISAPNPIKHVSVTPNFSVHMVLHEIVGEEMWEFHVCQLSLYLWHYDPRNCPHS